MREPRRGRAAVEEAVTLYRDLAAAEPARYTPDLAGALNNLGIRLHKGEDPRGLAAVEEVVTLYRDLVATEPARYTSQFAAALTNLGGLLHAVEEHRRGLAAVEEAPTSTETWPPPNLPSTPPTSPPP